MLFISTGIFDDKLHPQIMSVGTTTNSPLNSVKQQSLTHPWNNIKIVLREDKPVKSV